MQNSEKGTAELLREVKEILAILKSKAFDATTEAMHFGSNASAIEIIIEMILNAEDDAVTEHFAGAYASMRESVERDVSVGRYLCNVDDLIGDS